MAENQKLGADEALCWKCANVVVKEALVCPKCGQKFPGMSLAMKRMECIINAVLGITILVGVIIARILVGDGGEHLGWLITTFGSLITIGMIIVIVGGAGLAILGIVGTLIVHNNAGFKARERQTTTSAV